MTFEEFLASIGFGPGARVDANWKQVWDAGYESGRADGYESGYDAGHYDASNHEHEK
jgi:hypothetical protein